MAAPSFVAGHTTAQDSTAQTSRTISVPTHSSGDRIIAIIAASTSSPVPGISTFTGVAYSEAISFTGYLYIAYKTATGSEPASYTITSNSCVISAVCFAVTGAGGVIHALTSTSGDSATATAPAITTVLTDTLRISVVGTDDNPGVTSVATMTGHTLIATVTGSSKPTVSVQYKTLASAGTDAAETAALSGSEQWAGVSLAIANIADAKVTKAGVYAEFGGAAAFASKAGVYVESLLAQARATLAGVYVEVAVPTDTLRVTNYGAYVELAADLPDGDPSLLTATPISSSQIDLAWTDNSTNEAGFYIERSINQSVWNTLATAAADATSYSDTTPSEAVTYYYRVRAYNVDGYSGYSNTASALTFPAAPTIGTASAGSPADIAAYVTWTDNSGGETSQVIQHTTTSGSNYVTGATVAANATSGTDSSLSPNTEYWFRVGACNASGCSYSAEAAQSVTTGAAPQVTYDVSNQLLIDWDHDGTYTDESAYLMEARGSHRIAPPGQSITATNGQISQCTVLVDNSSKRFSSLNSGSAIYANIQSGKMYHVPVRINISITFGGTDYVRVFTGVARIPTEITLTTSQARTLAIDCRGVEEKYINRRHRTSQLYFAAKHDIDQTENYSIYDVLDSEGLSSPTDFSLDGGLHVMPWHWLDNESIIEALWQTASICGGRFYGRKDGVLVYENALHWLYSPHTTSQATYSRDALSSTIPFGSLELAWDETELAEEVIVTYTPRELAEAGTIYTSETMVVPPGVTKVFYGAFDEPVYSITALSSTAGSPGGGDLSGSVTITPTYYAASVKLSIANAATVDAYVNVTITGQPTSSIDSQQIVTTSADAFWNSKTGRSRSIAGNKFLQTRSMAESISNLLAERQETPSLLARMRGCPGNPNRTVGDRITISDTELDLSATDFYITAVTWRYSSRGYIQDIDAIRCSDIYPYVDDYFIIGTSTLGGGKRVFY